MNINEYRELVHNETFGLDVDDAINRIKQWLKDYSTFSNMKRAVIGISGGKDSTIVAKLLVDVLGKENVFGLLMPNGEQKDISDSLRVVELLGIKYKVINIGKIYDTFLETLGHEDGLVSYEAKVNLAPRIRMTTLYTFGQTHGCRVAGTGNESEAIVGYTTKFGDNASDFNIIAGLTSLEVMRVGEALGLPLDLVYKTPHDGLSGITDEEKLGLSYVDIHRYIRGLTIDANVHKKIADKMWASTHKRDPIPSVHLELAIDYNE